MSRIGKLPVAIPNSVTVTVNNNLVSVKGPKGELAQQVHPDITVNIADGALTVERPSDSKEHRSLHGLYRSLISNMVVGVSEGYTIEMEFVGVGYRAETNGQVLELSLGVITSYSIHYTKLYDKIMRLIK